MAHPTSSSQTGTNYIDAHSIAGILAESYIGMLPKVTQNEIFARFNAIYNGGVRDHVQGRFYLEKSLRINDFIQTVKEVGKDIEVAQHIIRLFAQKGSMRAIQGIYPQLSANAQKEIVFYAGKASLSPSEFQYALAGLFGRMTPFDYQIQPELLF